MKNYIKLQLFRSWNILKYFWISDYVYFLNEDDLTMFGKYSFGLVLGIIGIFWTLILFFTLPITLLCFKYDERIGF